MSHRLLQRRTVGVRPLAGIAQQAHVMLALLRGDRGREKRSKRLRLDSLDARSRTWREARQKVVHLADRALERCDHVGAELGIVGVPLGIARKQRQLADEILHVVEDEGEAAVEFLEALGLDVNKVLVDAMNVESARRLIDDLRGVHAEVAPHDGRQCTVAIALDPGNDGWLDSVLEGLQRWLVDSGLETCQIHLDGHSYVVERAAGQ